MPGWHQIGEAGSLAGIRATVWVVTHLGRRAGRLLMRVIIWWWLLLRPRVRRASLGFLRRLDPQAGFRDVHAHVLHFMQVVLDRIFLVRGNLDQFEITRTGSENLARLAASGQGAVLLGSHVGSFEAMRAGGAAREYPLTVVGYFNNAAKINSVLSSLNPGASTSVLSIDPSDPTFILELRARVERGELVAILGDRHGLGEKTMTAEFLGAEARFPVGPYLLASVLDCPVYTTFGLYRGGNRYELFCELFAETLKVPRRERSEMLKRSVERYAQRLEHYVRRDPRNWFNFYDFWATD